MRLSMWGSFWMSLRGMVTEMDLLMRLPWVEFSPVSLASTLGSLILAARRRRIRSEVSVSSVPSCSYLERAW
jgi:hypothetical protein